MEDPRGEGGFLSCPQQSCRARQPDDLPYPGIGFGVPNHQPPASFFMEGAADLEHPRFVIEIRPHEATDLTQPEAGG